MEFGTSDNRKKRLSDCKIEILRLFFCRLVKTIHTDENKFDLSCFSGVAMQAVITNSIFTAAPRSFAVHYSCKYSYSFSADGLDMPFTSAISSTDAAFRLSIVLK